MRLSTIFRCVVLAMLVLAIIGEEADSNKGAPIKFQTEVDKMLHILINSLYQNRAIFLREIISNASDALDKLRFLYLTDPKDPKNKDGESPDMDIKIRIDRENRIFYMRDGGVGMTDKEMAANLGSLGASGTKKFLEKLKEGNDANLIGQFGVGFYSVFLVADKVRVHSKSDDSAKQWVWESSGDGQYYLYEDEQGNTLGRGTELELHLKKDAEEFLELDKIKETIHRYSEFIHWPINLQSTKVERVPKPKKEGEEKPKEDDGEIKDEGEDKKEEKKEDEEFEEVTKTVWEVVNENKPIWTRKSAEVNESEYNRFYKSLTKDYEDPMYYTHFSAEGEVEFKAILFIPSRAPYNIFDSSAIQNNIRLYVRRVFITDEFRDLLPRYLNFIKGIVDSDDLPLNVSREVLQENRILKIIKKKLVRKALQMLSDIANNDKKLSKKKEEKEKKEGEEAEKEEEEKKDDEPEVDGGKLLTEVSYPKFWEEFGKNIRLGLIEDGANRARLTKLLRYKTSKSEHELVSLEEYVERMPESQKSIFYISGPSLDKIRQTPVLEDAIKRDVEVLYLTDAIDEYVVQHVTDFAGKKLVDLRKHNVKFEDKSKRDKAIEKKRQEKYELLLKWFKDLLGDRVQKVELTQRKVSEPLLIVSPEHGVTANMARIITSQTLGERSAENEAKRILEVNYLHPLVDEIYKRIKTDEKDKVAEDTAFVLFDTASLQNGFEISDTLGFGKRVGRLLRQSVDIAADAPLLEEDVGEYDIEEEKEEAPADGEGEKEADTPKEEL